MYFLNALHLKQFYSSDLGEKARKYLQASLNKLWIENDEDTILGLGYPVPIWTQKEHPKNLIVAMPAEQGASRWPSQQFDTNKTIVSHDAELPLTSNSINRVVLMHALECSPNVNLLMKEIYRVLVPNGRVMIITPNRMGLWSRSSKTPFGLGRPFSITELKSLIEDTDFTFRRHHTIMFMPPAQHRLLLKMFSTIEFLGQFFLPMCGGVHMVEVEKQIYANVMQPIRSSRRRIKRPAKVAMPTQSTSPKDT